MASHSIQRQLQLLCSANTTEEELQALRSLNTLLSTTKSIHGDPDIIEQEFLTQSKAVLEEGNPYPRFQVSQLVFPDSVSLTDFVHYLLTRRYGWSEVMPNGEIIKVQRIHGVGASSCKEALLKTQLNELLDDFIHWLLCQSLSHDLISSLKYTVDEAANHPVIRKQTFVHILEWFHSKCTVFHPEYFEESKELIILGLTDVWSAIRSVCSSKLNVIAEQFTFKQIEDFFISLVKLCKNGATSWQAREGAVLGLNAIIKRFQWVGFQHDSTNSRQLNSLSANKTEYFLKFGREELQSIPEFISAKLHDVIYQLLADPQLSIRENAIKAFSSYLSRCELQEALSSFKQILDKLCLGAGLTRKQMTELYSLNMNGSQFTWMDAYTAEGLLGMSIFLVKHISTENLLPDWSMCVNTFLLYLVHPASNVRQTTSKVIKFLVAKDTSNPEIVKLILSALSLSWNVDTSNMLRSCLPENYAVLPTHVYTNKNLIRNQSVTCLTKEAATSHITASDFSSTWEWREGRLLAYELIFQFLIKNHWLYTFGASSSSRFSHNSSGDEKSKESLRPLQTYGGLSLQGVKVDLRPRTYADTDSLHIAEAHRRSNSSLPDSPREQPLRPRPAVPRVMSPRLAPKSGSQVLADRRSSNIGMLKTRMPLQRRATLDHVNVNSLKTLVKHYSYFEKTRSVSSRKGSLNSLNALPLITAVKHIECLDTQSDNRSPTIQETSDIDANVISSVQLEGQNTDVSSAQQDTMAVILVKILFQTVECADSSSWELRRMSQQVLPCLVEVIRWYDMSLLEDFWSQYLTADTNTLTYGACLSYLHSVSHAAKLSPLVHDPPESWQNVESCKHEVEKIVNSMMSQMKRYTPIFLSLLSRQTIDRLTIITIQILLTSTVFSNYLRSKKLLPVDLNDLGIDETLQSINLVVMFCNPTSRLCKRHTGLVKPIALPGSGFLSCNPVDSDQILTTLAHTEKCLVEHMHSIILSYVRTESASNSCILLPALAVFLRKQLTADHTLKNLTESVITTLDRLGCYEPDEHIDECSPTKKQLFNIKNDCFFELLLCLTDQPSKHILCAGMDCLIALLQNRDSTRFILPLLKTVYSQHCSSNDTRSHSRSSINNLELLSNDIKRPAEETTPADDSESDDDVALSESDHMESLTLHNSGGTTSGRQSTLSQHSVTDGMGATLSQQSEEDGTGSDWGSWDESEEECGDGDIVYADFLKRLHNVLLAQGRIEEYNSSLSKLASREQAVIKDLLK